MSWDEAKRRYRSHSGDLQEPIAISSDRGFHPVNGNNDNYTYEPQRMDLDQSPTSQQTIQSSSTDAQTRTVRTPLPSGPRLERTAQAAMSLPGTANLQGQAATVMANPSGRRYSAVYVLLLVWQDEQEDAVRQSVEELRSVFDRHYHYTVEVDAIPSGAPERSWRWLSQRINQFMEQNDQRDVLKIFYYNGRMQLDRDREMVLTRYVQSLWGISQCATCSLVPSFSIHFLPIFACALSLPCRCPHSASILHCLEERALIEEDSCPAERSCWI